MKTIRAISLTLQQELAAERRKKDGPVLQYDPGDLVLFRQKETPCSFLPTKLSPDFLGPYEVIEQVKNDVKVRHIILMDTNTFHVDRLQPFFGTREEAERIGKHDKHQFFIEQTNNF